MSGALLARGLAAMRGAWAHRQARIGLLATCLIALGSLTPAYLPQVSPIWSVLRWAHLDGDVPSAAGTGLVVAGLFILIRAWLALRPEPGVDTPHHVAVLVLWALPFLIAPPIFSHDAYSYAAQAWLLVNGISPYDVGPGALPGTFADQAPWVWRFTPAPYGPLALRISQLIVVGAGLDPFWSAIAMRIPALVGVALIAWLLPRIAREARMDPAPVAWFGILNPVLVIDFVGGAHNDSLMMGLVVAGVWVAMRFRHLPTRESFAWLRPWASTLAGALVIGVAGAIKQPALLGAVALPFLVEPCSGWGRRVLARSAARVAASVAAAVGAFAIISIATRLGFGWVGAVNVPGSVFSLSPFTVLGHLLQFLLDAASLDPSGHAAVTASRTVGWVVSVVLIAIMAATSLQSRPLRFLSWSWLAFAFCAPALHSWYVLWGGLLLPLSQPSKRMYKAAIVVTLVLLCFAAINFAVRNGAVAVGIALVGGAGWAIRSHGVLREGERAPG